MGTKCVPLIPALFLICYKRDLLIYLSDDNQVDVMEVFNSISIYQDNLVNIRNPFAFLVACCGVSFCTVLTFYVSK